MSYQPKVYRKQGGDEQIIASGGKQTVESGGVADFQAGSIPVGVLLHKRVRATAAEVNGAGGKELLPALAGYAYRIADAAMIATCGHDVVAADGVEGFDPQAL